jgi:hypothetical protein
MWHATFLKSTIQDDTQFVKSLMNFVDFDWVLDIYSGRNPDWHFFFVAIRAPPPEGGQNASGIAIIFDPLPEVVTAVVQLLFYMLFEVLFQSEGELA